MPASFVGNLNQMLDKKTHFITLENDMQHKTAEIKEMRHKIVEMTTKIETLFQIHDVQEEKIKQFSRKEDFLKRQISIKVKEITALESRLKNKEAKNSSKPQIKNTTLQTEIQSLQMRLTQTETEKAELKDSSLKEIAELQKKIELSKDELQIITKKFKEIKEELQKVKKRNMELTEKNKKFDAQFQKQNTEIEVLHEDHKQEIDNFKKQIQDLLAERKQEIIDTASVYVESMNEKNQEHEKDISALQAILQSMEESNKQIILEQLEKNNLAHEEEKITHRQEMNAAEDALGKLSVKIQRMENALHLTYEQKQTVYEIFSM